MVDVLVLNAAIASAGTILQAGVDRIWKSFGMNVRRPDGVCRPLLQAGGQGRRRPQCRHRIHASSSFERLCAMMLTRLAAAVSRACVHPGHPRLERRCGHARLRHDQERRRPAPAADRQDVPPEEMQIVNFNPGPVLTQAARDAGYTPDTLDSWNDGQLHMNPCLAAFWLLLFLYRYADASWRRKQSTCRPVRRVGRLARGKFLHGRFVWTEWDVDELQHGEVRKHIDEDPFYLKIGVKGL